MVISSTENLEATVDQTSNYDKMSELKAFDDTKAGVKGLVNAGITKIPQIFILPPINNIDSSDTCETHFIFPVSVLIGLDRCYLKDMYCAEGLGVLALYYPTCRQPELTIGTNKHSDNDFLTMLLQDHIRGLQVLHQNQCFYVPPTRGALVVKIGDLLQASFLFLF
ncbi:hypothetical protein MTR67_018751 [Solanum verrucosum]|uniref:Fe2OG dioxygenase domain-containing protein n=1 Tax=Solanum verrucosum TaxID=315347 RepID=A0AAF0QL93_SOLVR|nr:hypothetical protein MTR67_018751 [Solanum verrucosum]